MKLTIVGCSGSYPGPDSPASCYLLEHDDHRIVLDMGNGSLGALHRYGDPYDLDAILISHLHVDHCIDLTSYYVMRKWHPDGPRPSLPVYGPSGTHERMIGAYDMAPALGMSSQFDFFDHRVTTEIGPFRITTARVDHVVTAYGFRVEAGGRTLVYSGDTAPTPALVELSRGADLALFEAAFLSGRDNPPHLHMTGAEAAQQAKEAGVDRLLLTHLVAWNDPAKTLAEAQGVWGDSVMIAESGLSLEV
jgi:ribonuclease BN (tRNA processing enzyme)